MVSIVVSFTRVRGRPARYTGTQISTSRKVKASDERWSALLESVLGATPREFESRILRHADLQEHR